MSIDQVRSVLLVSTLVNFGALLIWAGLVLFAKRSLFALVSRVLSVSEPTFNAINLGGISLYKLGIILFNLGPLIGLWVVG